MNTSIENLKFRRPFESTIGDQTLTDRKRNIEANMTKPQLHSLNAEEKHDEEAFSGINTNEMTVFLIDDDPAVCDALSLLLQQSNLKTECFNSADAFLDICHAEMQGCAIVDFNMPIMNGIQLQEELSLRGIPLPIVFLTGTGNIPLSVKAMKAGASDFLTKPVTQEKLFSSIHIALLESQRLQSERRTNQHSQAILSALTQRENDVMKLALKGHTSKKIANCLGISHRTVEIHKARLMKKTGAANILDLARIAEDAGITVERGVQHDLQNHQARR